MLSAPLILFLVSTDAITTKTADGTSVNATDSRNDSMINVENQQSFHDTNDGNNEPLCDYNGHDEEGGNILEDGMQTKIGVPTLVEHEGEGNSAELTLSESVLENSIEMNINVHSHDEADQLINAKAHQIVSGEPKTSETDSDDKYLESSIKNACDEIPSHSLGISQVEDNGTSHNLNLVHGMVESSHLGTEFSSSTDKQGDLGKSYEDGNYSVVEPTRLTSHDLKTNCLESDPQLNKSGSGLEELYVSLPESTASKMETATEDESTLNASLSQSSQNNIIDVLEEIIADARNNKVSVVSISYYLYTTIC